MARASLSFSRMRFDLVGAMSGPAILFHHREVLLDHGLRDPQELRAGQDRQQAPADVEGLGDAPVAVLALADELGLESLAEAEIGPVELGKLLLADDGGEAANGSDAGIGGEELLRLPRDLIERRLPVSTTATTQGCGPEGG